MRYIYLLVIALTLSACAGAPKKLDQSKVDQFVKGKTTYSEVVRELGPPTNSMNINGARTISYNYGQMHVNGATYIPVVNMFAGGVVQEGTNTSFGFDTNSILVSITSMDMGAGTMETSSKK